MVEDGYGLGECRRDTNILYCRVGFSCTACTTAVLQVRYSMAARLLGIQIDAAINPGNSGGPAFADLEMGKVAGVD